MSRILENSPWSFGKYDWRPWRPIKVKEKFWNRKVLLNSCAGNIWAPTLFLLSKGISIGTLPMPQTLRPRFQPPLTQPPTGSYSVLSWLGCPFAWLSSNLIATVSWAALWTSDPSIANFRLPFHRTINTMPRCIFTLFVNAWPDVTMVPERHCFNHCKQTHVIKAEASCRDWGATKSISQPPVSPGFPFKQTAVITCYDYATFGACNSVPPCLSRPVQSNQLPVLSESRSDLSVFGERGRGGVKPYENLPSNYPDVA